MDEASIDRQLIDGAMARRIDRRRIVRRDEARSDKKGRAEARPTERSAMGDQILPPAWDAGEGACEVGVEISGAGTLAFPVDRRRAGLQRLELDPERLGVGEAEAAHLQPPDGLAVAQHS
jgi:hypothetical protein